MIRQHTVYALGPQDPGSPEINRIPYLPSTAGRSLAKEGKSNHGTPFPSITSVLESVGAQGLRDSPQTRYSLRSVSRGLACAS